MKLIKDNIIKESKFEVGDIVEIQGFDIYLVCSINGDGYELRNLEGSTHFCSMRNTLEELVSYLNDNYDYTVYSHKLFGIKLIPLGE